MNRQQLDARRLLCPMPVIRTQDQIKLMNAGDQLCVTFTDPGALHDIPAWSRIHGHKIVEICEGEDESLIVIQVGGGDEDEHTPVQTVNE
jgi:TusA-related sulfurtransferase